MIGRNVIAAIKYFVLLCTRYYVPKLHFKLELLSQFEQEQIPSTRYENVDIVDDEPCPSTSDNNR